MSDVKIGVWINDVPVEFAIPFEIIEGRGASPASFRILTSKPSDFQNLKNPVEIKLKAPNASNTYPQVRILKNWYITSITPWEGGNYAVTIQDSRWYAERNTFTGGFNIQLPDGTYRPETILGPGVFWKALPAITKVLKAFGFEVEIDRTIQGKYGDKRLPRNQGNSEAGGWFAAKPWEILPVMLESVKLDIFQNDDGKIEITDRVTEYTGGLADLSPIEGHVAPLDKRYQKPKFIEVLFEQRVERIFSYNEDPTATATTVPVHDQYLENVVQDFVLSDRQDAFNPDGTEKSWFTEVDAYCRKYLGFNAQEFRKRYLRDVIIPDGALQDQALLDARIRAEMVRQHYRKVWLVKHPNENRGESRPYADQRLGRLGVDGNTLRSSYCFLDYVQKFHFTWIRPGGSDLVSTDYEHSKNYPFPTVFTETYQAPYDADWMSDGKTGLIFQLSERRLQSKILYRWPGLLNKPIGYGDVQQIIQGLDNLVLESTAELTSQFKLRVYYHGLLAIDTPTLPRLHSVMIPAFQDGQVDRIQVRTEGLTANWAYDDKTGNFPGLLLNQPAIVERANYVASAVLETLSEARSGVAVFSGIDPLAQSYECRGNINQRTILVMPGNITTKYDVLPGLRSSIDASIEPVQLDGVAPARIG